MVAIAPAVEWQVKASAGKCTQAELNLLGEVPGYQMLPAPLLSKTSFNGCLVEAARHSGLEDQDIAEAMHISCGYMSRFMRGVAQHWARRMVVFMRTTRSLAPLQWLADQMGCDVVQRSSVAAELAAARARVAELERKS